ncbi:beta-ketoacyl-[acyl-carrier-protein] synthase family protein [Streptomyces prunicolor]|uniref:beta-ketoacyl-[acyl-carrier-protein] synthase family protein n=1 Tax=Streptomyces prunicolor TaxID=67348 RepID=UPI0022585447|nr:beta-ketoacyl-[acyl-carrier-protein] synthase family protein [Streptomyces prunicolor]MCX5237554.1 beta-ketoacyl-[acyl-carrier-protein] synthase family protein [Streptomyces prunicolor]
MSNSSDSSQVPFAPHPVTAAEVIPGDLIALTPADAERACWYVVTHTLPETPETIRVTLRPPLGGTDHDEVLGRDRRVISGCRRLDAGTVPLLVSDDLASVEFREGDRVSSLRVVDPGADEVSYVRRWGVWHRDLDGGTGDDVLTDAEVRGWGGAETSGAGSGSGGEFVVRHHARPERVVAAVGGPRRVVVTGLGAVTPLGVGVDELWRGLLDGRHGIRELDGEEFAELPVRVAGTVPVDPMELLPRQAARRMNRAAQFAVLAAREAWGDAGFVAGGTRESGLDPERVGVSLGAILGDASVLVGGDRKLRDKGPRGVSPLTTPMTVPSQAASQVSLDLHITGEARTVTAACASGTEAIGAAIDRIRYGRVDIALAGGAEAVVTPAIMASFAAMRALSTRGLADGSSPSRPFAKDRDGFVNGEGAGVLVLEAEEHARARGARIYCEAAGWGLSADAHHMAAPDPSGAGVALAVRRAVRDAGGYVADVVHVNAHATATVEGDLAEAEALRAVFGRRNVPVTALKGNLGHLQGAAGGVEAVATVLTLHHGVVPPTVGVGSELDDAIGLDVVMGVARELPGGGLGGGRAGVRAGVPGVGDLALSNSFGFGGHNAVLALRRVG